MGFGESSLDRAVEVALFLSGGVHALTAEKWIGSGNEFRFECAGLEHGAIEHGLGDVVEALGIAGINCSRVPEDGKRFGIFEVVEMVEAPQKIRR